MSLVQSAHSRTSTTLNACKLFLAGKGFFFPSLSTSALFLVLWCVVCLGMSRGRPVGGDSYWLVGASGFKLSWAQPGLV